MRSNVPLWTTTATVAGALAAGFAQQAPSPQNGASAPAQQHSFSPQELVQRAVANEVKGGNDGVSLMFRVRRQTPKDGVQTREYVETAEGTAGMLVAVNDQPISAGQRQQEFARLEQLLHIPPSCAKNRSNRRKTLTASPAW